MYFLWSVVMTVMTAMLLWGQAYPWTLPLIMHL